MAAAVERLLIGFGSESGNAQSLARRLAAWDALRAWSPVARPLDRIDLAALRAGDVLLVISSSFGDGEPPGNAELFLEALRQAPALPGLRYAVFGLGDTGYPRFCGFTKEVDALLAQRQARAILHRVDADASYETFFARWQAVLGQVLQGDEAAGQALRLQVTAYGADHAYAAPITQRRRLSASDPAAWHVRLNIAGSGIAYRAGDNLYVLPENSDELLGHIANWYGQPEAAERLRHKELRQLGKTVLRDLARLGGSDALKSLLKVSQRHALDAYLHGADLLDVLQDHGSPQAIPLDALAELLPPCLPRAYSIASHSREDSVDLCVREVRYEQRGRMRTGAATGWLLGASDTARIFSRANPGFYLPRDTDCPLILIGTGTGIAPLMGLLQEVAALGGRREICLIFGEKRRADDFLYREEIEAWRESGVLERLITAFSRDGDTKYYVQHAIADHAGYLGDLLRRDAHIYLCGNKRHLEQSVQDAIASVLAPGGTAAQADAAWQALAEQGRLHRELY